MSGSKLMTILRDGSYADKVRVSVSRSHFTFVNDFGVLERITTVDFIVSVCAFERLPGPNTPQESDVYILGVQYHPTSVGGRPMWRWCDGYHRRVRIHVEPLTSPTDF